MRNKLRELLEHYFGFQGTDLKLLEIDEKLRELYRPIGMDKPAGDSGGGGAGVRDAEKQNRVD